MIRGKQETKHHNIYVENLFSVLSVFCQARFKTLSLTQFDRFLMFELIIRNIVMQRCVRGKRTLEMLHWGRGQFQLYRKKK